MRIRDVVLFVLLVPALARAADVAPADASTDTYGKLLAKEARVLDSEMDAKIRANQGQAAGPASASPLPGAKQAVVENEPVLESVWGLKGKEVVEARYKGRAVPLSMQAPDIPNGDGWRLESIRQYEVLFVQMRGNRVVKRKPVTLDWLGGEGGGQATLGAMQTQAVPVMTPSITSPVVH